MADSSFEFSGKTVDDAVAEGLAKLGVSRSDVAVEVLSRGSRGIFGIGSEAARVRITLEPAGESSADGAETASEAGESVPEADAHVPAAEDADAVAGAGEAAVAEDTGLTEPESVVEVETDGAVETDGVIETDGVAETAAAVETVEYSDEEVATMASEMLGEIVRLMGFDADVVTSWQAPDDNEGSPYLLLDIEGEDLGALIGRRGETLASLQYLVRLMVNQRVKQWRNIVVDVEKYKERRVEQLNQLALRMANQVMDSGRSIALEPMPPNERRIVHLALRDHPDVYTQSSGEGDRRKVNIVPRDTA